MACFSLVGEGSESLPDGFVCKSSESGASFIPPASAEKWIHWLLWFSSWKMLLLRGSLSYEQKGLFRHLTATYRKRLEEGRKGRTAEKTSNLRRWGASFLKPLELTHPCGSKAVMVLLQLFPPRNVIPLSQIHFPKTYLLPCSLSHPGFLWKIKL